MLHSLRLKNLALVSDLRWQPKPGFNTLTGETGAGKSILIGGLSLLLGERADKTLIRTGEESCTVEAELEIPQKALQKQINSLLEEIGAENCEGSTLLLKRTFTTNGTNKQFANGSPVTLAGLKKIGDLLVDVHGPHDHQSLLHIDRQLEILDAYGKLEKPRQLFQTEHQAVQQIEQQLESLQMGEREKALRLEMLKHQVSEISGAKPVAGEDETIEQRYRLASNSRHILELASTIHNLVSESDSAILTQLAAVEKALLQWQRVDPSISDTATLNRSAIEQLKELSSQISNLTGDVESGASDLPALEERLNLLQKLKKKYGPTLEDVIRNGESATNELSLLEDSSGQIAKLEKELAAATKRRNAAAATLTEARTKAATPLAQKIQKELRELGFSKAGFGIDLTQKETPTSTGKDEVEFIFTPNQGETPRPLRSIASSGEMARVMLAIKTTLAEVDEVPVLVFDEIDANVGGETATVVGEKLRNLGKSHQVICITHLPQVAAQGQTHFSVSKAVENKRTVVALNELEGKERISEIARMLGGQSEKSLALAKSLLK